MNKPDQNKTAKRRFLMPAVVLGLLGGHMVFIVTAIMLGTGDASFAVVPDYYAKAVDYDDRKTLLTQSDALGWSVELSPSKQLDAVGQRELIVQLRDRDGQAITGMNIQITVYHLARASEATTFACVEVLPGQYVGTVRMSREGFWQFAVDASRDGERFVAEVKQFVFAAERKP